MDPMNQNPNVGGMPTPNPAPAPAPQMPEEHKSSAGPIIGSVIIILIIVLGGLYLYGDKVGLPSMNKGDEQIQEDAGPTADEISASVDQSTVSLGSQGATDAVDEIEADLSATDLNSLDAELANISQELSF